MRILVGFFITSFLATITIAKAQSLPFAGRFQGTGRACHGTLAASTRTLSWHTTFSQCESMTHEQIGQEKQGDKTRMAYRRKGNSASCRYAVLTLTHAGTMNDTGWEVTGYGSEQSYQADKASGYRSKGQDIMSCYLVRQPEK